MSVVKILTGIPIDSNIWLVRGRSGILIDAGTGLCQGAAGNVLRALDGIRLSAIVLTHCHADHAGGLADLKYRFGCPAYIGRNDAEAVRTGDVGKTFSGGLGVSVEPCPDILGIGEGDSFDVGDHRLSVIETPGHTDGGICLYDETTGALFSGDTLFAQGVGRMDLPTGSFEDMKDSLLKLSNVNIKTLYPGHGPSAADGSRSLQDAKRMIGI